MKLVNAPFYQGYIDLIQGEIGKALEAQIQELTLMISNIPESKWHYKYEAGKWTVAQLIRHCIDTERIMAFRALSLSRDENAILPGYAENDYAAASEYSSLNQLKMADEYYHLRKCNLSLFQTMPNKILSIEGEADGKPISVLSLWYIIAGHWKHHQNILNKRYL
ncbi:DinB family protein [Marivirga arenosa]|uniref:DinB family protein n=1 Tax=Marivirga arenosa TaxID=3059076 RepID=A0AA49GEN9_9BACT|nr:DinB family protein [Marivirga sp. ABR2-2]WKK84796.1 DinB family protein [Marivirga sp. ABR2-2]